MAWNAKKISIVAGALALVTEAGINNALVTGVVYAAISGVAAPVVVHGVVKAHDTEEARLAADRANFAGKSSGDHRSRRATAEAGDADQQARQSNVEAEDSPDMPRRLGPMLIARRTFLEGYDAGRASAMLGQLDQMLKDDRRALKSFERKADLEPVWAAVHRADLATLRDMDTRLAALRARAATD